MLHLSQPAVTGLVKRAVDVGLVATHRPLSDRRGRVLTLTPEGKRRLTQVFEALRDDRVALLAGFEELDVRFHEASG